MKAEDVMKALECCFVICYCNTCPYYKIGEHTQVCTRKMAKDALALLREKDAEIEMLREMNDALANGFETFKADIEQKMVDKVVDKVVDTARKQAFVAGDNQYISIAELEEIAKGVIK